MMTSNAIRQAGYWVINGHSRINYYISSCVTCKRLRSDTVSQKMADLPKDRLEETNPFDYTGVDYFGPFVVKSRRSEVKRYGVIFTCLTSRAVHLEVADSLTTDSYINALRRFISYRGPIRVLRSDRGTNFVGAKGQLTEAKDLDYAQVQRYLLNKGCDFKMNPPAASHFGGVWERMIRSARAILDTMLSQLGTQLDDECLRTLMAEVMAILNGRPLAAEHINDHQAPSPLTPNHLLTMKSEVIVPPPGEFTRNDMYCVKRWRRVQYMVNQFWQRWRREYLATLQLRTKQQRPRRNLAKGDIVIIKDDSLPRNQWQLGRVEDTYNSSDDLVRSVKLFVGRSNASAQGRQKNEYMDRPVDKLVLLVESTGPDSTPGNLTLGN